MAFWLNRAAKEPALVRLARTNSMDIALLQSVLLGSTLCRSGLGQGD